MSDRAGMCKRDGLPADPAGAVGADVPDYRGSDYAGDGIVVIFGRFVFARTARQSPLEG